MHSLLIHQAFCLPSEAGGTRHFELAGYAVADGQRFSVVASTVSYITGDAIAPREGFETLPLGMQVLRASAPRTLRRGFAGRIWSFLVFTVTSLWSAWRVGPVDVVIGTSPPIFQTLSAWLLARLRRCRFLLEVRDLWPEFAVDMGIVKNRLVIAIARWFERWLYRRADHIVVNSPAYRRYLIDKGVAEGKITLIANGVDPEMFDPEADGAVFRDRWADRGKFVVTYAGALGLANDIPTLLRAAERLKGREDIVFWLVGEGAERARLEGLAVAWGLANVRFTGPQPKSMMKQVLAASDACVAILEDVPMFRTTYPNKVFDYLAAGRPVILGIDGVIREVVDAAGAGVFVSPGDDQALAAAVTQLEADRVAARRMGLAGRAYVVTHFSRQQHGRAFAQLLRRVAGAERA